MTTVTGRQETIGAAQRMMIEVTPDPAQYPAQTLDSSDMKDIAARAADSGFLPLGWIVGGHLLRDRLIARCRVGDCLFGVPIVRIDVSGGAMPLALLCEPANSERTTKCTRDWQEGMFYAARLVEDNWNNASDMVNAKQQAERFAAAIRANVADAVGVTQ